MTEFPSLYTETQQLVLGILPYFSAPFSMVGSGLIIYVILSERKFSDVYQRLMLGLSCMDLLNSTAMVVFTPWAVPEGVSYVTGARGTFTTCEISGFFLNLFYGSMFYTLFLAIYFLLLIRFEWKQRWISRYIEPVAHLISILFPIVTGAYGISKDWMNPLITLPGFCGLSDYPPGCSSLPEIPCVRGEDYNQFVSEIIILLVWIGIIVCMTLIVLRVCRTERRIRNYAGGRNSTLQRTKETGIQAILYIFIFLAVFGPVAVLLAMQSDRSVSTSRRSVILTFAILTKLISPMQGFFNAFVYLRKRIRCRGSSSNRLFRRGTTQSTTAATRAADESDADETLQEP